MQPRIKQFEVNLEGIGERHKISYAEWDAPTQPSPAGGGGERRGVLICIHGLTRNGRDFDVIAAELSKHYRVIAPDMPGRGKSDWLKNFYLYNNDYYVEVTRALIASFGAESVDWLGTSMGGLMGMIAAAKYPKLINKMVLNDIGPYIDVGGMRRIATYVKDEIIFPSLQVAQQRMREIYSQFGITDEGIWQHMFDYGLRPVTNSKTPPLRGSQIGESDLVGGVPSPTVNPPPPPPYIPPAGGGERRGGGSPSSGEFRSATAWSFNHDPKLGAAFKKPDGGFYEVGEFDLWRIWDAVKCPVLVLRGETSDILSREVAERMTKRAGTELVEFKGYGHVPPLLNEEQIGVVSKFLVG